MRAASSVGRCARCSRRRRGPVPWMACGGELSGIWWTSARRRGTGPSRIRPHQGTIGKHPNRWPCRSSSDAADPQSPDPAAVPGWTGHLRVARGQRDVFSGVSTVVQLPTLAQRRRRLQYPGDHERRCQDHGRCRGRPAQGRSRRRRSGAPGRGRSGPRGGAWSTSSALRPIIVRRRVGRFGRGARGCRARSPKPTGGRRGRPRGRRLVDVHASASACSGFSPRTARGFSYRVPPSASPGASAETVQRAVGGPRDRPRPAGQPVTPAVRHGRAVEGSASSPASVLRAGGG